MEEAIGGPVRVSAASSPGWPWVGSLGWAGAPLGDLPSKGALGWLFISAPIEGFQD